MQKLNELVKNYLHSSSKRIDLSISFDIEISRFFELDRAQNFKWTTNNFEFGL